MFPDQHIIDELKAKQYKVVFLMRDPRDQLVSTLLYIRDRGWTYGPFTMGGPFGDMDIEGQIDEMITGSLFGLRLPEEMIGRRLPWMALGSSMVYTAYYENLVGPLGEGTREAQIAELTGLSKFLKLKLTKQAIEAVADTIYGRPGEFTFNIGKIGSWKDYFNGLHQDLFKVYFGRMLIDLGYEHDCEW